MVFIIQNTQNRDGSAVQAKLDAQSEVLRLIAEKLDIAETRTCSPSSSVSRTRRPT